MVESGPTVLDPETSAVINLPPTAGAKVLSLSGPVPVPDVVWAVFLTSQEYPPLLDVPGLLET